MTMRYVGGLTTLSISKIVMSDGRMTDESARIFVEVVVP
jgi:hypothetical protein